MLSPTNTENHSLITKTRLIPVSATADGFTNWGGTWYTGSPLLSIDTNPTTAWTYNGLGSITYDLGSSYLIDAINISYQGSVSNGNYVEIYVDDQLVSEGSQPASLKSWDITDVSGRYITYKTVAKPHNEYLQIASWSEIAEFSVEIINTPITTIPFRSDQLEAIGFTPDGKFLIIKSSGVSNAVSLDSDLVFAEKSVTAEELIKTLGSTPVFASLANGETKYVLPNVFTGPASLNLKYQLIDSTLNAVVTGSADNDFIKLANTNSTGKAVDGGGGDDVIDGGVGSTFISGGGGSNTFFLDGRASGVSWSTITDFAIGVDKATIWGWNQGVSKIAFIDEFGGVDGYKGLTLHFENLLPSDASMTDTNSTLNSITFSGKSLSDFGVSSVDALNAQISAGANPFFSTGQTVDEFGTHGYLYVA